MSCCNATSSVVVAVKSGRHPYLPSPTIRELTYAKSELNGRKVSTETRASEVRAHDFVMFIAHDDLQLGAHQRRK